MSAWLVSPTQETTWRLDPEDFAQRLTDRWPGVAIVPREDVGSVAAYDFELLTPDGRVLATLPRDGQAVWVDADLPESAHLAAWVREIVCLEQELAFYNEGYTLVVDLIRGVTAAQIEGAIDAQLGG